MKKLIFVLLLVIPIVAGDKGDKFPTNQWEWWIEAEKSLHYDEEKALRIKSESINTVLGFIMYDLKIKDNIKYHVNFSKTNRKYWENSCCLNEDTNKMLNTIYWRLIHLWSVIDKDSINSNVKIKKLKKKYPKNNYSKGW